MTFFHRLNAAAKYDMICGYPEGGASLMLKRMPALMLGLLLLLMVLPVLADTAVL